MSYPKINLLKLSDLNRLTFRFGVETIKGTSDPAMDVDMDSALGELN